MTASPNWLEVADVVTFHAVLIAEFGGSHGVRDAGVLQSAVARPRNRFGYETKDWFELAATYAHGIVKNHPFVDGNKRVAFVAARVFLGLNGLDLRAPEEEVVLMTVGLAEGSVAVATYAAWLRKHSRPKRKAAARRRGRRQRG